MSSRKIGERFDFEGHTLEVVDTQLANCHGCFFENLPWCFDILKTTGPCVPQDRDDEKWVIFKVIK